MQIPFIDLQVQYHRREYFYMKELRFGVIGWGYWGPKIARNLESLPHATVSMVADVDALRIATLASQTEVETTTDIEQVFRSNVDGVIIKGKGHWLMEEAPQQVIPKLVAFINKSQ